MISEWSSYFDTQSLEEKPVTVRIVADTAELAALERRSNLLKIKKLSAEFKILKEHGMIHILGKVRGEITQNCVVSGKPFDTVVEDSLESWFADQEKPLSFAKAKSDRQARKSGSEREILDEKEDPEPLVKGRVDLGELAAQHFILAIDPYPRAPDLPEELGLPEGQRSEPVSGGFRGKNPFEALKKWRESR